MTEKFIQYQEDIDDSILRKLGHVLFVLPPGFSRRELENLPGGDRLLAVMARRDMKIKDLSETPVGADLAYGGYGVWVVVDSRKPRFEQLAAARKGVQILLGEHPHQLAVAVFGSEAQRRAGAEAALYSVWVNSAPLPQRKRKSAQKPLSRLALHGFQSADGFAYWRAQAEGNLLARELTMLPANELTPAFYRNRVRKLAKEMGWGMEELDLKRLRKMGAGAFVAVAQGSQDDEAAIVHLSYRPAGAEKTVALVGKGICFDTGGHNLKPARYMHGMHEDMNGSAVALGILLAATRLEMPVAVDCWLALAQNHISPKAYKQNEVVTALNGTTIEIVHTDAEGRMVLADTLTLAARQKPDLMVDFATLTGSCITALGNRYSGIFSNREHLAAQAVASGKASGERVCAFPLDADYDTALDSKIADVKQCTMEGEADHILAARFLQRFAGSGPWVHMDLSASRCEGGLGAVAGDVTGFGVGWGLDMLSRA